MRMNSTRFYPGDEVIVRATGEAARVVLIGPLDQVIVQGVDDRHHVYAPDQLALTGAAPDPSPSAQDMEIPAFDRWMHACLLSDEFTRVALRAILLLLSMVVIAQAGMLFGWWR